jgi:hypothetical protein
MAGNSELSYIASSSRGTSFIRARRCRSTRRAPIPPTQFTTIAEAATGGFSPKTAKENVMKKIAMSIATAIVGVLLSAASVYGQTVKADIPFSFHAANQSLPAGEYEISTRNTVANVIVVRNTTGKQSLAAMTNKAPSNQTSDVSKLIFRRYGDQYFLAQIFVAGRAEGTELIKTKAERRLLKSQRDHLAHNVAPELVTILVGQ